jgi:hypothetical protein
MHLLFFSVTEHLIRKRAEHNVGLENLSRAYNFDGCIYKCRKELHQVKNNVMVFNMIHQHNIYVVD